MKKILFLILISFISFQSFSQMITDSAMTNKVVVHEDYRLSLLARRESDINTAILEAQARIGKGFRLMVLNTYDRAYAMKVRGELLQKYPDQKTYMWFANPYIRIKFGNFKTEEDAEPYRREISKMLDGATIYVIPDNIEVKPDKDFDPDNMINN